MYIYIYLYCKVHIYGEKLIATKAHEKTIPVDNLGFPHLTRKELAKNFWKSSDKERLPRNCNFQNDVTTTNRKLQKIRERQRARRVTHRGRFYIYKYIYIHKLQGIYILSGKN